MKTVIFAGGLGTRISEETVLKPKPMVEIGDLPILMHIMKIYLAYGHNEFIVCLGYKGEYIKEYFYNLYRHSSDMTIDLSNNHMELFNTRCEPLKVHLVDTGTKTQTAGRLKRIQHLLDEEDFFLTYGDGLADVDLNELLEYHQQQKKIVTLTAIRPEGRFGNLEMDQNNQVINFKEKNEHEFTWINGGFFVVSPQIFDYLHDDADRIMWEEQPLNDVTRDAQLAAYKHYGFWKCLDAMRDKIVLENLWNNGGAKWKIWE